MEFVDRSYVYLPALRQSLVALPKVTFHRASNDCSRWDDGGGRNIDVKHIAQVTLVALRYIPMYTIIAIRRHLVRNHYRFDGGATYTVFRLQGVLGYCSPGRAEHTLMYWSQYLSTCHSIVRSVVKVSTWPCVCFAVPSCSRASTSRAMTFNQERAMAT